jgi:hypothetical protein
MIIEHLCHAKLDVKHEEQANKNKVRLVYVMYLRVCNEWSRAPTTLLERHQEIVVSLPDTNRSTEANRNKPIGNITGMSGK